MQPKNSYLSKKIFYIPMKYIPDVSFSKIIKKYTHTKNRDISQKKEHFALHLYNFKTKQLKKHIWYNFYRTKPFKRPTPSGYIE